MTTSAWSQLGLTQGEQGGVGRLVLRLVVKVAPRAGATFFSLRTIG